MAAGVVQSVFGVGATGFAVWQADLRRCGVVQQQQSTSTALVVGVSWTRIGGHACMCLPVGTLAQ